MMVERVHIGHLKIARKLVDFVNQEVLPDTNLSPEVFWAGSEAIIAEFSPKNRLLLQRRDDLQAKIDQWHRTHSREHIDITRYKTFLYDIGYLVPESDNEEVRITTTNVDEEIATKAGPQLVVPLMNARFTLNAANARWGSLYDALYGTDAITETDGCEKTAHYNPKRGEQVIAFARKFLDQTIPLANEASHTLASRYMIDSGLLKIQLADGTMTHLKDPNQWLGYQGSPEAPTAILFIHHGLHVEIQIDREQSHNDPAGIRDILIESAITTIVDCEDSVAAVDTDDKIQLYRNWLGLMKGDLAAEFHKGKELIHRKLNPDRIYTSPTGAQLQLPGRSLLFIRHVGHLLYTDAILDRHGEEIPEGILDALVTTLIALQDLNPHHRRTIRNSRQGSIYVVKPKQHGPEEVAFTCQLFSAVEDLLQIPRNTLKIGVMDEERRTSLNLTACIREAKDRLAFINTGFLDRTGDEIHTSMLAGPMLLKAKMKDAKWFLAYEKNNVQVGLKCGLMGKAQIGKGMWAIPDKMAAMLEQKMNHLKAGATCAWVPSPTAATLHALHYHQVDAVVRQNEMMASLISSSADYLDDLLTIPILSERPPAEVIQRELDNNAQSILGYVVRWIDQGIGCSKVPDIDEIGLMEDRATLRISSQHIANWYKHGLVTKAQIEETFQKMAKVVDRQNATSPDYHPMAPNLSENIAFQAALELVLQGDQQPNGYTEPILHRRRREYKARNYQASSS